MIYKNIDTSNTKPDLDFEQVQSDLAKFKSHTPMPEDDVIALMKYIGRFEQLISGENYSELGYISECFMCRLRDILAILSHLRKKCLNWIYTEML